MKGPNPTVSDATPNAPLTEIILIRHAPADAQGRLVGRTDVGAVLPGAAELARVAALVGAFDHLIVSPARRCVQTAAALFPGRAAVMDDRLWEQDFGLWEGRDPADVPDLGPLPADGLAHHAAPAGESFADVCARARPALAGLPRGRVVVVAHAGTVRAALALALGAPGPALAFAVAPLSLTGVRLFTGGASIGYVNRVAG